MKAYSRAARPLPPPASGPAVSYFNENGELVDADEQAGSEPASGLPVPDALPFLETGWVQPEAVLSARVGDDGVERYLVKWAALPLEEVQPLMSP